jgi:hypothetical protein
MIIYVDTLTVIINMIKFNYESGMDKPRRRAKNIVAIIEMNNKPCLIFQICILPLVFLRA